ncbi:MAG: hypothetical protein Q8O90_00890 [Elusimicrobiota bacterium]|nr:hypothetical protein [Elusimicrobiota bacterium]
MLDTGPLKLVLTLLCLLPAAATALTGQPELKPEVLVPSYIPAGRRAQPELTPGLRAKIKTLGLNDLPGAKSGKVSKALLLLPRDRGGAGVLNFEIEGGKRAGIYQCEALGRGLTSSEPKPRWPGGFIGGSAVYYAPKEVSDGATVPGVYDLRNISPERYEIVFLGKPEDLKGEELVVARTKSKKSGKRPFFSAVWKHWYPKSSAALPVDMVWAEDSQAGTQGEGVPVFEQRSSPRTPEETARQAKQLSHNPRYYFGPYGRSGFAVHTDRWAEPERTGEAKYAGRPELTDFRYRDTNGCVKLRPACLELLNEFISGQEKLGRRAQLEVLETPLLDNLPVEPPAAKQVQ